MGSGTFQGIGVIQRHRLESALGAHCPIGVCATQSRPCPLVTCVGEADRQPSKNYVLMEDEGTAVEFC